MGTINDTRKCTLFRISRGKELMVQCLDGFSMTYGLLCMSVSPIENIVGSAQSGTCL